MFRNFNDFLKFIPWILFLKIKTQSPKEVSQLSQKKFLLCEHLIPSGICEEYFPAQLASRHHNPSACYWNRLTSVFWCRSTFSPRRQLTRDVCPFWVAISKAVMLCCKTQVERAGRTPLQSNMLSGIHHVVIN